MLDHSIVSQHFMESEVLTGLIWLGIEKMWRALVNAVLNLQVP
jgi:hypothetical protein